MAAIATLRSWFGDYFVDSNFGSYFQTFQPMHVSGQINYQNFQRVPTGIKSSMQSQNISAMRSGIYPKQKRDRNEDGNKNFSNLSVPGKTSPPGKQPKKNSQVCKLCFPVK